MNLSKLDVEVYIVHFKESLEIQVSEKWCLWLINLINIID